MAGHTPGPWTVGEAEKRGWPIEAERTILEVRIVAIAHCPKDARLIAAAPAMLEALKGLIGMTDDGTTFGSRIQKAKTAIAAAEGTDND